MAQTELNYSIQTRTGLHGRTCCSPSLAAAAALCFRLVYSCQPGCVLDLRAIMGRGRGRRTSCEIGRDRHSSISFSLGCSACTKPNSLLEHRIMKEMVYTLAAWRVQEGRQQAFISAWKDLGEVFNSLS